MVVLVETDSRDVALDSNTISQLASLGVTNLALVRDERTVGIVLEGWAFDPPASTGAALAMLTPENGKARVLHPLGEMAVSATQAPRDGGVR
jgi:hypothetical protein